MYMKNRGTSEIIQMTVLFIGSIIIVSIISSIWQQISEKLSAFPG